MADETSHVGLDVQDFLSGLDKMIKKGQDLNKTLRKSDLGAQQLVQGLADLANEMKALAAQQKNTLDPKNFGKVLVILDKITQQLDEVTKATTETVQGLGQVGTETETSLRKVATTTQKSVSTINRELKSVKDQTQLTTTAVKQHRIEQERKFETASRTKSANDFIKGLRNTIAISHLTQAQTIKLEKTFAELSKEMVSGSKSIGQYETAVDRIFKGQARAITAHPKLAKIVQSIAELGQRATEVKTRTETKTFASKATQEKAKADAEIARLEEAKNKEIEATHKRSYKRRTALISAHLTAFIASKGIEEAKLKESELAKLNIQKASIARSLSLQKEIKVKNVPTLLGTMAQGLAPEGLITATKELNNIVALTEKLNAPSKTDRRRVQQEELAQITESITKRNAQALSFITEEKLRTKATIGIQNFAKALQQEGATAEQVAQGQIPITARTTEALSKTKERISQSIEAQRKLNTSKTEAQIIDTRYTQILSALEAKTQQVVASDTLSADEARNLRSQRENAARALSTDKAVTDDYVNAINDLSQAESTSTQYTKKSRDTMDTFTRSLQQHAEMRRKVATLQVVKQQFQLPSGIESTQTQTLIKLQEKLSAALYKQGIAATDVHATLQAMLTPSPKADILRAKYENITLALDTLITAQQRAQRNITGPTQITQVLDKTLSQYGELIGANEQLGDSTRQTAQNLIRAYTATDLKIEDLAENMERIRRGESVGGSGGNKPPSKDLTNAIAAWDKLLRVMEQAGQYKNVALHAMQGMINKLPNFERYSTDARISLVLLQKAVIDAYLKTGQPAARFAAHLQDLRKGNKDAIIAMPELAGAVRNFDRQVRTANASLQGFTLSIANIGRLVVARIVTAVFYRMWNQMEQTFQTATQLSKAIGEIQTISQAASITNDQWAASIHKVSNTYNLLQTDLAEGLYQTISNQVALGRDAMLFMEQAAPFAKATKSTMTETVELLSSVLNSYNMGVHDLDQVTSSLFRTIELGRVRASEMANTFGRIGGIAEVSGIQLNELLSTIVILTRSGLKFERASTFILNVMNKLIKPSKEMQQLFSSWGVTSGQAAINVYGLSGVIDKLGEASGGMVGELAEDFRDLRAILGGITLVRNAEKFKSTIDSLADSFEYYQNAVDIAMQSSGENITRELLQLKNEFITFSTFLLDTAAAVNKWGFTQYVGGFSGIIQGLIGAGLAFGPASILSLKFSDNIDQAKKSLETMELGKVNRALNNMAISSGTFASKMFATTKTLPVMNTFLAGASNTLTSMISKMWGYTIIISALSQVLIAIERKLFVVNVENTKFSKTMEDAAMHARKLMAALKPTKDQTTEREKQKLLMLQLNKQALELEYTQKRLLEGLNAEFKARDRLAEQQKSYLQKIREFASEMEAFQRESRWEQMLPLNKLVDQTDYIQARLREIQKIMADPTTQTQGPILLTELLGITKDVHKNFIGLTSDMAKVQQRWSYGIATNSKDAIGEAQQLLEKWNLTPMEFGPQLFASIDAEKGRLDALMNEIMAPMFASAGITMPEGGVGEFGDLTKSLQMIAETDKREIELERMNETQTEVKDFLKEVLKGDIKDIKDILTASLALSTGAQANVQDLFSTDSVFTDFANQLIKSRKDSQVQQAKIMNEAKGTPDQIANAFVKKFTTLGGPLAQTILTAKTVAEATGNKALADQIATSEKFFLQLAEQPAILKQPDIQDQMLRSLQDLTMATNTAANQKPGLLKTAWLTFADILPGVSGMVDRYRGTVEVLVPNMNKLVTETAINIRSLRNDERNYAVASLENMPIIRKELNAQVNNATINIANANMPAQARATGGVINGPKGTDTVPAWLTPGEFVVNAEASKRNAPLLHAINAGYYAEGGPAELTPDQRKKKRELRRVLTDLQIQGIKFDLEAVLKEYNFRATALGLGSTAAGMTAMHFGAGILRPVAAFAPAIQAGIAPTFAQLQALSATGTIPLLGKVLAALGVSTSMAATRPKARGAISDLIQAILNYGSGGITALGNKPILLNNLKPTKNINANNDLPMSSEFFAKLRTKLIPKYAVNSSVVKSWPLEEQYDHFGIIPSTGHISESQRKFYKQPSAQRRLQRAYTQLERNQQDAAQYTTLYETDKGEVRVWDGYQDLSMAEYQWTHGQSPLKASYTQTIRRHVPAAYKGIEHLQSITGKAKAVITKQVIRPNEVTEDKVYSYAGERSQVVFNGQQFSKENFGKVFGEEALKVVEQRRRKDEFRANEWANLPGNRQEGEDGLVYQWDGFKWRNDEEWKNLYSNKFAKGGSVGGPRGTDTVPAWLTPGEFVVNARSAQRYGSLLERLNSFGSNIAPIFRANGRGYATGGQVPTNNYQIKNDITLQSTGQETIDARRLVTAINREVYRGTLRVRTAQ